MDPISIKEFARIVEGQIDGPQEIAVPIQHVSIHSGRIRSGAAFFALEGSRDDGHSFVDMAAKNGASAAVVKATFSKAEFSGKIPLILVDDPLSALQRLAAWWRLSLETKFVAIVGSVGKTVTKDCLLHVLSQERTVYGTPGSYNSQLGVPLAVLDCPKDASTAIIEIAVSDPGEMSRHSQIVQPDYVLLTNVGSRWSYRFNDRTEQIREMLEITKYVSEDGWLLLGQRDDKLVGTARKFSRASLVATSDLPAFNRRRRDDSAVEIDVRFPNDGRAVTNDAKSVIHVANPSDEIAADVELAISGAWLLGIEARTIEAALEHYTPDLDPNGDLANSQWHDTCSRHLNPRSDRCELCTDSCQAAADRRRANLGSLGL